MVPSCAGVGFSPALLVAESLLAMFFGYTGREQRGTLNKRCNDGSCPKKCSSQLEQQRKIVSCHGAQHLLLPSHVMVGFIPDTRPRNKASLFP